MPLERNVILSAFGSYKIGGPARFFWRAKTLAEVKRAVREAKRMKEPLFILGGGTNLLIPDEGFPSMVLKPDIKILKRKGNSIEVGAGVLMSELLDFTVKEGLSGLEWAGGLPGTVGGAIRGNAGAFGGETKDKIITVTSVDSKTVKTVKRKKDKCKFKYRSSIFKEKKGREIIVSAVFRLGKGERKKIRLAIDEKIQHRLERHPMDYPNIGSIFKNVPVKSIPKSRQKDLVYKVKMDPIPVIPTARLISQAGLKGVARGGAMISVKHPNFIVNVCEASEKDVIALMDLVRREIKKKFSVELEEEVERLRDKFSSLYSQPAGKTRKKRT